ncbi:hypothetical protein ZTR_04215 [Talaromyces verruculosus]|nr:hypothetical protein ZTR_04215 [Talaromyces verruculosus]
MMSGIGLSSVSSYVNWTPYLKLVWVLETGGERSRLEGETPWPDLESIHRAILQDAKLRQEPADLIKPQMDITPDLVLLDDDDLALDLILQSMSQLLASKGVMAVLEISQDDEHICEHLMVPLRSFLRDESEIAAILWQGGDTEKPDCRNLVWELSKKVQKSTLEAGSALESSGKRGKAGKKFGIRLKAQAAKRNAFSNEHRSGLYYKSSWTAGYYMVEILDMAFSRCTAMLKPPMNRIPLLEQLSQLFLRELFLGAIPEENFSSQYCKAVEQGFDTKTERRRGLSKAATISKFEADRMGLSLFHELTSYDYQPTNEFFAKVYIGPTLREPTRNQLAEVSQKAHSVLFSVPLDKIKTAISKEFTGDLHIRRTNLFPIFRFCTEVLRSISEVGYDSSHEVLDIITIHLGDGSRK